MGKNSNSSALSSLYPAQEISKAQKPPESPERWAVGAANSQGSSQVAGCFLSRLSSQP